MKVTEGSEELQVVDYVTAPIQELITHSDVDFAMLEWVGQMLGWTQYHWAENQRLVGMFQELNWRQREKVREMIDAFRAGKDVRVVYDD